MKPSRSPHPSALKPAARNPLALNPLALKPVALRFASIVLAATLVLSGCGINMDDGPRAVGGELSTTTTVADQPDGEIEGVLYYVIEGSIVPATALLSDHSTETLIQALLKAPPKPLSDSGAYSSIPSGTELIKSHRSDTLLLVDLTSAFDNVVGVSRQQAIAQIVLTVTQQPSIRSVEFQVDGEKIQVSSPIRGDRYVVTNCDFRDLLATTDQAVSAGLSDESVALLEARRARLKLVC
ncbi:MAG TPA: GerMN domain-containing protein [Microthrixaceae bacterium]|nr:GerMN domain-containing protein [Microthrixaceae bacterium]